MAHVPVLFGHKGEYRREANRFLRERATLTHREDAAFELSLSEAPVGPRPLTLKKYADGLHNFFNWCNQRGHDWKTINYKTIIDYQKEMESGAWSTQNRPLSPETANARADIATEFLAWAALRSIRRAFHVRTKPRSPSHGARHPVGRLPRKTGALEPVRAGRAKTSHTKDLLKNETLPSPLVIRDWLLTVQRKYGYAKYLACRFILETGVRSIEAINLVETKQARQLPSLAEIQDLARKGARAVQIDLVVTKGGRPRTIDLPLDFALELRQWADTKRPTLRYRARMRTGRAPGDAFFLSDAPKFEGTPISYATLYKVFRKTGPIRKFSPHIGRHIYACFFLLRSLDMEAQVRGGNLKSQHPDWIHHRGDWYLKLLQRQLGHLSDETTFTYLRLIKGAIAIADVATNWHLNLSEDI
ncbi:site-specific integrase [Microvirga sp. TS319]|uniref:site-specific integrase n=1 Tax=Microvirga sp. TS319 TaxID=3241165 RepID=UPI00351A1D83